MWDLIVVGGGHSGCEAAYSAAKIGCSTLLLTMQKDAIGRMSCNPAIGGIGKGHLVKEIDALGGIMGFLADKTAIQFRTLNTKKGAAVQATRCQSDMQLYSLKAQEVIANCPNLEVKEGEAVFLLIKGNKIQGVETKTGEKLASKIVIVTGGTFLNGVIHIGKKQTKAGRFGEKQSNSLATQLRDLGIKMGRLKTGTTPRLDKKTINFKSLETQLSDTTIRKFSFWESQVKLPQQDCHLCYTNQKTHQIIRDNIHLSAMYNGNISSSGPRYCPSIEDKIVRFADKQRHQIFLEPTSLNSDEIYPNGISTSLPVEIQQKFIQTIQGLEQAKIIRAGYAIEYDYVFPQQLKLSLELKDFDGLFLAGQINGTTGYEEAAAQGIWAGINAARKINQKDPLILTRNQAYLGVLVDDLVTKGTKEPYRMFTSRAEYRLLLREENADQRLSTIGYQNGLLSEKNYQIFCDKYQKVTKLKKWVKANRIENNDSFKELFKEQKITNYKIASLLKKPTLSFEILEKFFSTELKKEFQEWNFSHKQLVENDLKYEGYIKKQQNQLNQYLKMHLQPIPINLDYGEVGGLSAEVKEKLFQYKPETLAQMLKISGITPAAATIMMVYLKNKSFEKKLSK